MVTTFTSLDGCVFQGAPPEKAQSALTQPACGRPVARFPPAAPGQALHLRLPLPRRRIGNDIRAVAGRPRSDACFARDLAGAAHDDLARGRRALSAAVEHRQPDGVDAGLAVGVAALDAAGAVPGVDAGGRLAAVAPAPQGQMGVAPVDVGEGGAEHERDVDVRLALDADRRNDRRCAGARGRVRRARAWRPLPWLVRRPGRGRVSGGELFLAHGRSSDGRGHGRDAGRTVAIAWQQHQQKREAVFPTSAAQGAGQGAGSHFLLPGSQCAASTPNVLKVSDARTTGSLGAWLAGCLAQINMDAGVAAGSALSVGYRLPSGKICSAQGTRQYIC